MQARPLLLSSLFGIRLRDKWQSVFLLLCVPSLFMIRFWSVFSFVCHLTFHFVWVGHHCSACEQGRAKENKAANQTLKAGAQWAQGSQSDFNFSHFYCSRLSWEFLSLFRTSWVSWWWGGQEQGLQGRRQDWFPSESMICTPRSCSRPRPCPCRLLSPESAEEGKSKDCKEEGRTDGSDLRRSRVALALLVLVLVLVDFIH